MKRKIKIAIVIPNLKLEGAQNVVKQLALAINKDDFEIIVIVLDRKCENLLTRQLEQGTVSCRFMKRKTKLFFLRKVETWIWLSKELKKFRPDLIHVHLDYYYCWLYAFVHKQYIIETIHTQPYRINNFWIRNMLKILNKYNLIKIVVLTKSSKSEFSNIFGYPYAYIDIISNPVNVSKFAYLERSYRKGENLSLAFIARFHPIKNHKLLLAAFQMVLERYPKAELFLAGIGETLEESIRYAEKLKIINSIHFLNQVDDTQGLLRKVDIFVISSDSEVFPLVLLEAMASGLPIVTTSAGGIRDIFDGNGIMVEPGNKEKLAEAIIELIENYNMREKCGRKSLEIVSQYDIKNIISQYEKLYREIYDNYN